MSYLYNKAFVFFALAASLFPAAGASGGQSGRQQKQDRNQQQNQIRDQLQQTQQQEDQKDLKSFEGKIAKKRDRFFLEASDHKNSYRLSEDWKAKHFLGKTVRITGTLDEDSSTIHVRTISQIPERKG